MKRNTRKFGLVLTWLMLVALLLSIFALPSVQASSVTQTVTSDGDADNLPLSEMDQHFSDATIDASSGDTTLSGSVTLGNFASGNGDDVWYEAGLVSNATYLGYCRLHNKGVYMIALWDAGNGEYQVHMQNVPGTKPDATGNYLDSDDCYFTTTSTSFDYEIKYHDVTASGGKVDLQINDGSGWTSWKYYQYAEDDLENNGYTHDQAVDYGYAGDDDLTNARIVSQIFVASSTTETFTAAYDNIKINGTGYTLSPRVKNTTTGKGYAGIQPAIDDASAGNTINVAAGTYVEQVIINKDLTLQGSGNPTIKAPSSPAAFKFPESSKWWEPVVFAFGGTANPAGEISGAGQVTVNISGLVVDGDDRVPTSGCRSAGVLLRNVVSTSSISSNTVQNMYIDSAETFGIIAYGDCNLTISGNTVSGYARGGIAANGDIGPLPDPTAVITGNTVTGPGLGVSVTWAPNGIQIGWGAAGEIHGNNVSGNGWPGTEWSGSGIIIAASDNVLVKQNTVTSNETGIAVVGDNYFGSADVAIGTVIQDNTVQDNTYGIALEDRVQDTLIEGNTITGSTYDGVGVCNFYGNPPTGTEIHYNDIYGNNTASDSSSGGLWVDTGVATVDAEYNWWGDASGPYHDPNNTGGSGNAVIGDADYSPWLGATSGTSPMEYHVNNEGGTNPDAIQDAIDAASEGDTIVVHAGTYNGFTVDRGVTLVADGEVIIGPGSHGTKVIGNGVTLDGFTYNGTGCSSGDAGIYVNDGVQRTWIRNCEVKNWCDGGIKFDGASTDVKVVDNYAHNNANNGLVFMQAPGGTVKVYGNAFRNNGASGIYLDSGSLTAEYNEWGHIDGAALGDGVGGSGTVDWDPWVFGKLKVDPASQNVRETEQATVYIKMDVHHLYGIEFDVTFSETLLQLNADPTIGSFQTPGEGRLCTVTNAATANGDGTIHFKCNRADTDPEYDVTDEAILTLVFNAQDISGTDATSAIDIDTDSVVLGAKGGVNIFVDSATDGSVKVLGTTTVNGVVDLQGRDDDSDAVVDPQTGAIYSWGPAAYTTGSWGTYSFSDMTDDEYTFTVEMPRYLDASKTVNVENETLALGTVMLLGGDCDDSDKIEINDAIIVGGAFGSTPTDGNWASEADINADDKVNILDAVLLGGNWHEESPVSWTP